MFCTGEGLCDPIGATFMFVILIALVIGIYVLFIIPSVNKKRKLGNKIDKITNL